MLPLTGCAVILFGLVGLYGYNNTGKRLYRMAVKFGLSGKGNCHCYMQSVGGSGSGEHCFTNA